MFLKKTWFFAVLMLFSGGAGAASLTSDYGMIKNVPTYSSMPGGQVGAVYNQKFPQPIYAQGTDLTTNDCQRTVANLIANYCAGLNNCYDVSLSDARPALMVQLSRLPGHNFATACAGYIDSEFDAYVRQYGVAGPVGGRVTFPTATAPNNATGTEFKIQNPYEMRLQDWQIDYKERAQELERLQSQNDTGNARLVKSDFPATFADLSFEERMDVLREGYEPYKDATAYVPIKVEDLDEYQKRVKEVKNVFCGSEYKKLLAVLDSDLASAKKCKSTGLPISECSLQGTY